MPIINFKNKKYYLNVSSNKKYFEMQSLQQYRTRFKIAILINFPCFFFFNSLNILYNTERDSPPCRYNV